MTPSELSAYFFVQVALIIATCRIVGYAARRWLGQPQVVGEMIAGVVLGPSLFGYVLPDVQAALFPADTKNVLFVCAQMGVGLYMFLVGLGFRSDHFRSQMGSAAAVSFAGMAAPFLVAVVLAPILQQVPGLFASDVSQFQATLFLGACIAITAFPMLARIIHERGLTDTRLGSLTLSAGAIDDAAAWTVLAIVLASFGDGPLVAIKAIVGGASFAAFMLLFGRRLLAPLGRIAERDGKVTHSMLAVVLVLFMLAAFAMDYIGIHAVFGGFVLGICMPRGVLASDTQRQLEPVIMVLLIPMFFAYSGLNTQLTVVNNAELLMIALGILAASILAKGVACYAAARLTGQDNATAMAIGALMNARGLMELIIINIGLQRGIIGPALFSMLVIMAIATTFMASPLFDLVYGRRRMSTSVTDASGPVP
ncbi:cation:proton antiporter [Blastomonas sp.]|uniref:cation:proton antiporter n=1 Tax=Blastomonas sp. TaxID=1909299 RepID=UPI0026346183|nr:cation:proton antiporter [Blastomonas sp.]MDM7956059.1 cation:proton antiporter [Blastomonas sp.]